MTNTRVLDWNFQSSHGFESSVAAPPARKSRWKVNAIMTYLPRQHAWFGAVVMPPGERASSPLVGFQLKPRRNHRRRSTSRTVLSHNIFRVFHENGCEKRKTLRSDRYCNRTVFICIIVCLFTAWAYKRSEKHCGKKYIRRREIETSFIRRRMIYHREKINTH